MSSLLKRTVACISSFAMLAGALYSPAAKCRIVPKAFDFEEVEDLREIVLEEVAFTAVLTGYDGDAEEDKFAEAIVYNSPVEWRERDLDLYYADRDTKRKAYLLLKDCPMNSLITIKYYGNESYIKRIDSVKIAGIEYVGDVNSDSVIDAYDLVLMKRHVAGITKLEGTAFENADIDDSGEIDNDDVNQLSDYLLGRASKLNEASPIGSIKLSENVTAFDAKSRAADDKFISSQMNFAVDLFKNISEENNGKNILLSPLSAMAALAMTANGADSETLSEMEKALGGGMSISDLNEYLRTYIYLIKNSLGATVNISDSIWFKETEDFKVKTDFLRTNKTYYDADAYQTNFDKNTVNDINSWVNTNTNGLIKKLFNSTKDFDKDLLMCLINTLYFEADWDKKYDDSYDWTFTNISGEEKQVPMLSSQEYYYYETDDAKAFRKDYKGNKFSFVGILPDENTEFNDFIAGLDGKKIKDMLYNPYDGKFKLYTSMPKLKYDFSTDLSDALKAMGIKVAFDRYNADFSNISDFPTYIGKVIQKTSIEVTEEGTKAAAVTAVMMMAGAAFEDIPVFNVNLNRPYVYMIIDNTNNLPLFIGAVTDVN